MLYDVILPWFSPSHHNRALTPIPGRARAGTYWPTAPSRRGSSAARWTPHVAVPGSRRWQGLRRWAPGSWSVPQRCPPRRPKRGEFSWGIWWDGDFWKLKLWSLKSGEIGMEMDGGWMLSHSHLQAQGYWYPNRQKFNVRSLVSNLALWEIPTNVSYQP